MAVLRRRASGRVEPGTTTAEATPQIVAAIAAVTGAEPGEGVAVALGFGSDVYDIGADRLARVVAAAAAAREAEWVDFVRTAGIPAPEFHTVGTAGELGVLIAARPVGTPLVEAMAAHMTSVPQYVANFGRLQARLHELDLTGLPPACVPAPDPLAELVDRAAVCGATDTVAGPLAWLKTHAGDTAAEAPVACHGEFNVIHAYVEHPGTEPVLVVDWAQARVAEPSFDVARTAASWWAAPYFVDKFTQRTMLKMLRDSLGEAYLNAYHAARSTPVDPERLRYWDAFQMVTMAVEAVRVTAGGPFDPWDPAQAMADAKGCAEDALERLAALTA